MLFYSIAVLSFFVFFCHIMIKIHQDVVSDSKVIKKKENTSRWQFIQLQFSLRFFTVTLSMTDF